MAKSELWRRIFGAFEFIAGVLVFMGLITAGVLAMSMVF